MRRAIGRALFFRVADAVHSFPPDDLSPQRRARLINKTKHLADRSVNNH